MLSAQRSWLAQSIRSPPTDTVVLRYGCRYLGEELKHNSRLKAQYFLLFRMNCKREASESLKQRLLEGRVSDQSDINMDLEDDWRFSIPEVSRVW